MKIAVAFVLFLLVVMPQPSQAQEKADKSEIHDNGTKNNPEPLPFPVRMIPDQIKTKHYERLTAHNPDEWNYYDAIAPQTWSTWLLVVVGFGGVWAALRTLSAIRRELVLTQRPKISIRNLYFSEPRGVGGIYSVPAGVQVGSNGSGQFYIVNSGGSTAYIQEILCQTFIGDPLPMRRPFEGQVGDRVGIQLQAGQSATWLFGRSQPIEQTEASRIATYAARFHVLGFIHYRDELGIGRVKDFCRYFDTLTNRFVPAGNPDYESED
jgi:hypothetical protein